MTTASNNAVAALRAFKNKEQMAERCELCATVLAGDHSHLFEPSQSRLLCACDACSLLFYRRAGPAKAGQVKDGPAKYVRVPRQAHRLTDFRITDAEWNALMLPIDMAFFQRNSRVGRVLAYYPSPAGCTESLLELDAWRDLARNNRVLDDLAPDVETLLVNRTGQRRCYYIAPIDQCYKLAGLIRVHWQGLSGGELVWRKIEEFFESLDAACLT